MKVRHLIFALLVAATTGVVLALAIHQRTTPKTEAAGRRFHVRGEVREIDVAGKSIRIKHEAIPDYMAAMTMPFDVRDAAVLSGLKVGDEVGFELVVTGDDSWIEQIQKLGETKEIAAQPDDQAGRLQPGETVPDFALVDQNGRAVHLRGFSGKAVLLTFIYTRCPLPNFCPLMSKNFASLQQRLEKRFPGQFQLLSVTIDPEFDQPAILKEYASRHTADDSTWTFGTGSREQTDAVGAAFGLVQERAGGLINHDLRTALISPEGRLVHVWKSNAWTPYEVERRVGELFGKQI